MTSPRPWWQNAVVYQIYPRSFADSTGSGVGDLRGVTRQIEYLAWLGVDAIWLSPFFPSPMHDFGYDVSDYCDVDPLFGTLDDFDAMVSAAHDHGIRVIIDWVPAHTSSEHPWFREARSSRASAKRAWYVWRDPVSGPDGEPAPPNNWVSAFGGGGPAWTFDDGSGQYYLHSFLAEQPDLDWDNPDVVAAMHDVLRFWMDRGVDGFRADVIHNIGKDPLLPDVEGKLARIPHCALNDVPRTHELLREIRALVDSAPEISLAQRPQDHGGRMMVGEVFLLSIEQVAAYYGHDDELHLSFNFPPLFAKWNAAAWRECIEKTTSVLDPIDAWPTWVLSNHDQPRHRTRHTPEGGEAIEERARAAAVLLLTLRGTPFLYMGEELGLENTEVPEERVVDPGGRDGCRSPIPWNAGPGHGWGDDAWLPFPPQADLRNVQTLRDDPESILHLYRRLLQLRRASQALCSGSFELLSAPEGLLVYRREAMGDQRLIAINFGDRAVHVEPASELGELWRGMSVELASHGVSGRVFEGSIDAHQALILR